MSPQKALSWLLSELSP